MSNLATREALVIRWDEACRDPALQDLPYKIEINARGKIVWLVAESGGVRYVGSDGERAKSSFGISISLPAPIP